MKIIVIAIVLLLAVAYAQQNNCLVQNPGTLKCEQCNNNLQLDNLGQCRLYTPIEGCRVYDSNNKGCVSCIQSFLLVNGVCLTMIQNCQTTTNVVSCDQCSSGFVLIRYSKCLSTDIANCSSGSLPRSVQGVSYCEQYSPINCLIPALGNKYCSTCLQGYTSINGICFRSSSSVPCPGNNCQCQGYYNQDQCYNLTLSNCLTTQDKVYCSLCDDNYFISQGFCVQFVKADDINCNLLTLDGSRCSACNLDYVLDSNFICVRNFNLCPNGCNSCPYNKFTLYEGNCLPEDPLCRVYNFTTQVCVLCAEGYILDPVTRICIKEVTCLFRDSSNICQKCFTGYQLNLQSYQCIQLPPNCL